MSNFLDRHRSYDEPGRFAESSDYEEAEAIYWKLTGVVPRQPYYCNHNEETARLISAIAGAFHDARFEGKREEKKRIGKAFCKMVEGL